MKKNFVAGATLLMALLLAAPSFALETKVTGTLTFDGVMNYNPDLASDSDAKKTVDYREMQLRIHTESKVNDNITLYTRFDILDKVLSSQYSNTVAQEDDDNIQFDHAWMQVISPIGLWRVGRKTGIKWGTDFFDDGDDYGTDRLEWILPINVGDDKFVIGVVGEKALETKVSNRDNEKYYVTGTYVNKDFKTGLLIGYYDYQSFKQANGSDDLATAYAAFNPADPTTYPALFDAVNEYSPRMAGAVTYISPYFSGKIGGLNINAEFDYVTGEAEAKDMGATETAIMTGVLAMGGKTFAEAYGNKKDVDMMAYWLEVGYDIGPSNIELGYAFMSGDADGALNDLENSAALAPSEDWEKLLILTSDDTGLDTSLGSLSNSTGKDKSGNILNTDSYMNEAGLSLIYLGASYDVNDSLSFGGIFGMATADAAQAGWDDDYGMEIDLSLSWKFLGNLEYNATAGYLMAGDFWKGGVSTAEVDDLFAFYHEVVLSF